ncbi:MAG: filamentous hemagglutinin N-terminal domain-containing protein, partial [Sulfuritalea sp.]|nr:filamentous hemagglutinin N-terminal domain-containing protein [Sulfuritalea sp.]
MSKSVRTCRSHAPANSLHIRRRLSCLAIAACFASADAFALPVGAQVVNGTATMAQAGNVLTVTNSNGAIINWQQFNIGAGQTTRFEQASASSSVLNRVLASDPSVILGNLTSNGRVWLVNPAGIFVGQGARIDAAAFVASTLNVTNADFLANRMKFDNSLGSAGNVVNQGKITTPMGGSVYLIGSNVTNEGIITTPRGETILAAGQTVELIDSATPGVKVEITGAEGNVTNLGAITAEAGRIGIAGVVVRNSGRLNASSVVEEGGRIFLRATKKIELTESSRVGADGTAGGSVTAIVSENGQISGELVGRGEISAQGNGQTGSGGFVETSAAAVRIEDGFGVRAGGGSWLIDPLDFTIASGSGSQTISGIGATTLQTNLAGTSVTIQTDASTVGNGDIFVNSAVSWSSANSLTLQAHRNIDVNANLTSSGTGTINLHADFVSPDGIGAIQRGSASNIISQAAGTVTLRAGSGITATVNGTSNILDAQTTSGSILLDHSSGILAIESALSLNSLTITGGTLQGAGNIDVSGAFNWTGTSAIAGSGTLTTLGGSTTAIAPNF